LQAKLYATVQFAGAVIKMLSNLFCQIVFVHGSSPFDFKKAATAWVAREQCVLTLPSEQPIAAAV
jgi:hypothetical protein